MDLQAADTRIRREIGSGEPLERLFRELMSFGHRAMGSEGDRRSREYAAGTLRSLGLEVDLQEFEVPAYRRGRARAAVSAGGETAEVPCLAFLFSPSTPAPLTLDLVAAGSGNPEDIARLGAALRGRAAYARPGDIMRSVRARNLTGAGAAACVFGSHTDAHDGCIISYIRREIASPVPTVGMNRTGTAILERFLARGRARLTLEVSGETFRGRSGNVVAERPGRTALPAVVVGGHLDSYDLCEGALDNGAGAAVILETARVLSALPRPLRTVRFALFTGEEVANTGSRKWVAESPGEPGRTGLYVNVDMPVEGGVPGVLTALGTGDAAIWERLREEMDGAIPVQPADDRFSDHVSFAERGVPCFWIHAFESGTRGPARIEHTALDTPDKVDPAELRDAALLTARLVLRFAEAETLPVCPPRQMPPRPLERPAA